MSPVALGLSTKRIEQALAAGGGTGDGGGATRPFGAPLTYLWDVLN
jgi:hypothetical protein